MDAQKCESDPIIWALYKEANKQTCTSAQRDTLLSLPKILVFIQRKRVLAKDDTAPNQPGLSIQQPHWKHVCVIYKAPTSYSICTFEKQTEG